jgi:hypothetical protein
MNTQTERNTMTDAMGIVEKIALMGRDAATEAGWPQGFIDAALELHGSDGSANPHTPTAAEIVRWQTYSPDAPLRERQTHHGIGHGGRDS